MKKILQSCLLLIIATSSYAGTLSGLYKPTDDNSHIQHLSFDGKTADLLEDNNCTHSGVLTNSTNKNAFYFKDINGDSECPVRATLTDIKQLTITALETSPATGIITKFKISNIKPYSKGFNGGFIRDSLNP